MSGPADLSAKATLRRIIEQREREQVQLMVSHTAVQLVQVICCLCWKPFTVSEAMPDRRVCDGCATSRAKQRDVEKREGRLLFPRPLIQRTFDPPPMPVDPPPSAKEEPMAEEKKKICNRLGCGETLRSDNTSGACARNCRSPNAPAFKRAQDVDGPPPRVRVARVKVEPKGTVTGVRFPENFILATTKQKKSEPSQAEKTLHRFRLLMEALGLDADAELAEYAQGRIDQAMSAVRPAPVLHEGNTVGDAEERDVA